MTEVKCGICGKRWTALSRNAARYTLNVHKKNRHIGYRKGKLALYDADKIK